MDKLIIVNSTDLFTRIALLENNELAELYIENLNRRRLSGNIYCGIVTKILPGMQAAFVDIGLEKDAFLYIQDITSFRDLESPLEDEDEDNGSHYINQTHPEITHYEMSIDQLLKLGQKIIVQITREPMEMKGARVSTNIALPGRYLVILPTLFHIGISKRIRSAEERNRLRVLVEKIKPNASGVIVRTVAEGCDEEDLRADIQNLNMAWLKIQSASQKCKPPSLLHRDLDALFRVIRDLFDDTIKRVLIDTESDFMQCKEFVSRFAPSLINRIELYTARDPIFDHYNITGEIEKALQRKVWLPSGGYIVIDQTEAMVVIDVNTGRFVGTENLEDTVYKTNLEAADIIARQIRLRGLGGIIVMDFIDMEKQEHREEVIRRLQLAFECDKGRVNISPFTPMGLVEMTRKRTKRTLQRTLLQQCPTCSGSGHIKHPQTIAFQLYSELKDILSRPGYHSLQVKAHPSLKPFIDERIEKLRSLFGIRCCNISVMLDPNIQIETYRIFRL
ncbi:Rne/Rng family ribonuclease [bacterium]|nr:Rne/Rng family ribonuclease [candidate division CSSED10-310 bacterium]